MRSSWGNVKIIHDKCGPYVIGCPRKKYTRKHPYPEQINRFNPLPREKAAIVLLRKHGYAINTIAGALGRSTSFIHKILRFNVNVGNLRFIDMRKLPGQIRLRCASIRWNTLQKFIGAWEKWILGEGEKPP